LRVQRRADSQDLSILKVEQLSHNGCRSHINGDACPGPGRENKICRIGQNLGFPVGHFEGEIAIGLALATQSPPGLKFLYAQHFLLGGRYWQ
jgi:hypothetical protein